MPAPDSRLIRFQVCDIFVPDADAVLRALHGHDLLCGRLLDYTDGGAPRRRYAVVAIDGLPDPVVVPVDRLHQAPE